MLIETFAIWPNKGQAKLAIAGSNLTGVDNGGATGTGAALSDTVGELWKGNDERWGETKHGAIGHTERPLLPHRPALRRLPCPCSHKRSVPSLSRQPVSPRPPSPVGPWRCTCATRWGCSIKIRTSRRCSPLGDNRRTGSVKSQAERVLGTRKRRAVVGRERRCCRKAAISVVPVRRMRVSTRLRQAAMIWGAGPLRR